MKINEKNSALSEPNQRFKIKIYLNPKLAGVAPVVGL